MISPALEASSPCWCELVGQPGDAARGMVEDSGGDAGLLDRLVAVEQRADPAQVDLVDGHRADRRGPWRPSRRCR